MSLPPTDPVAQATGALAPGEAPAEVPASEELDGHPGVALRSVVAAKLAATMFLHHLAHGAWVVTLGSYVMANAGSRGSAIFDEAFVGLAYGAGPLGGMVSPFITGLLADQFFATERMMAALNVLCALMLFLAAGAESQTAFFAALVGYYLCYLPSFTLATSMSMAHLAEPVRHFPVVRACGTVGWIAGGVLIGLVWPLIAGEAIERSATPMRIAIGLQLVTAGFCLLLPHTPPARGRLPGAARRLSLVDVRDLLRHPLFVALMALAVLAHMPSQFYYAYSNAFLNNWMHTPYAAAKLTLGQIVEVACMLTFPFALARARAKTLIVFGLAVWAFRLAMLAAAAWPGSPGRYGMLYAAILLHGVAYTYVTISLQLEVDRHAGRRRRATAQGLLTVAIQGCGCFVGAALAGLAGGSLDLASSGGLMAANWAVFWGLAAAGASLIALLAAILLPRD